ncbi:3-isopropylmalate dehydratase small subunit [Buchnera aphidicola]|uniref:3-isopropylmalate dehydratase small subunit n=1 Tax=Buchnera aphidicola str. Ua (Uroleucon ambrosiae) TaxID=1005057 RepID=G2LQ70_BUCUM|nr:3-isopropylmalate dehydratase small subunit [Buchnera aphidicola]AEO08371.1 isopropylmalate isomerase small subunit [Buchnera aphidicola str. Ua (Uroleucon ambrosiae)]
MFKFIEHTGVVVPLNFSNIDTDIIIPKQFLKHVSKKGLGKFLFHDWRFIDSKQLLKNKKFVLNQKIYTHANILLTGENFGCGSSREHAVWSLLDYGFKVIIAPSFSDIFYSNSLNNKLLLINLEQIKINVLFDFVNLNPGAKFKINLTDQKIIFGEQVFYFHLEASHLLYFSSNLDNIDLTMKHLDHIKNYETRVPDFILNRRVFESNN